MRSRRDILKTAGLGAIAASFPSMSFAQANTDARFVLVVLRGAVDGLALVAPYGDGNYKKVRGELAIAKPGSDGGVLKLDGMFGLNPGMPGVYDSYVKKEALLLHAIASPYRSRSHFDGQDVLENGSTDIGIIRDGWLNRALQPLGGSLGHETAIALAQNTPLVLRGENSVSSWAPSRLPDADDTTLDRLQDLYADDEFFATRLAQARNSQDIAEGMNDMNAKTPRGNDAQQVKTLMDAAANFLTADNGPQVAVLEFGGWDTHANQGSSSGALANRLSALDAGLTSLRNGMGSKWSKTVVAVVTEFGRTVHVNGTRGTDHGTATAALLLGGAVSGGRVITDWPGLAKSNLYDGRDLMPTSDIRSMFKGVLAEHLDLSDNFIDADVFPNSGTAKPMRDIIRS